MTKAEREQSLIKARQACLMLCKYAEGIDMLILGDPQRAAVLSLIAEFERLDAKERKQREAGKQFGNLGAEHGQKGGRPRKHKPRSTKKAKKGRKGKKAATKARTQP